MGPGSAHRKGTSFQMPCRHLKHFLRGGMENGDLNVDLWDLDISHHAVAGQVQAGKVFFVFLFRDLSRCEGIGKDVGKQLLVVGEGFGPFLAVVQGAFGFLTGNGLVVGGDQAALPVVVPLICHKRIQQQGQTG